MVNKHDNIIAYRRVSSDDQAKGYSLDVQKETFERFQTTFGFGIALDCKEDHSAKTFNRPQIKIIKQFIKENKGLVNKLLVIRWDRFSRNVTEAYAEIEWFLKHGVEVNALEQWIDFEVPEQKMLLAIYLAAPEVENLRRGANVKSGMRKAMLEGRWLITPPRGYTKVLDAQRKPNLVINAESKLVVNAFELYGSGNYSQREALKMLQKKGLKMQKSQFSRMLNNVAYIGKIKVSASGKEPEQIVNGMHEALISEDLFNRTQLLLTGKKTVTAGKVRAHKEELPLRGFIKCKTCGKKLTGSPSRGNGGVYHYYHCHHNCATERYRAEAINKSFVNLLETIEVNREVTQLYYEIVRDVLKAQDSERDMKISKLDTEIEAQKVRIEKLQDLFVDEGIKQHDYNKMMTRYEDAYNNLIMQRTECSAIRSEFDSYLKWGLSLMGNLKQYYQFADVTVKQQIIGSIFTEMMVIEENKVRTTSVNEMVALITRIDAGFKKKNIGQSASKAKLSAVAENTVRNSNQIYKDAERLWALRVVLPPITVLKSRMSENSEQ